MMKTKTIFRNTAVFIAAALLFGACQDAFKLHDGEAVRTSMTLTRQNNFVRAEFIPGQKTEHTYTITDLPDQEYKIRWQDSSTEYPYIIGEDGRAFISITTNAGDPDAVTDWRSGSIRFSATESRPVTITVKPKPDKNNNNSIDGSYGLYAIAYELIKGGGDIGAGPAVEGNDAVELKTLDTGIQLQWNTSNSYGAVQTIYRKNLSIKEDEQDWIWLGQMWNRTHETPLTGNLTFVDYLAASGKQYKYYVSGQAYDFASKEWQYHETKETATITGNASDDWIAMEDSNDVSYNRFTGVLTFNPPLQVIRENIPAGMTGKIAVDIGQDVSVTTQLYDGPVYFINLIDELKKTTVELSFIDGFQYDTTALWLDAYPVYAKEEGGITTIIYPNAEYNLTGDVEGIIVPTSASQGSVVTSTVTFSNNTQYPSLNDRITSVMILDQHNNLVYKFDIDITSGNAEPFQVPVVSGGQYRAAINYAWGNIEVYYGTLSTGLFTLGSGVSRTITYDGNTLTDHAN
jgi:hypothetical protein